MSDEGLQAEPKTDLKTTNEQSGHTVFPSSEAGVYLSIGPSAFDLVHSA